MREEAWYKDVEESLMILHAKIDQLKDQVDEMNMFLGILLELNSEEEPDGNELDSFSNS